MIQLDLSPEEPVVRPHVELASLFASKFIKFARQNCIKSGKVDYNYVTYCMDMFWSKDVAMALGLPTLLRYFNMVTAQTPRYYLRKVVARRKIPKRIPLREALPDHHRIFSLTPEEHADFYSTFIKLVHDLVRTLQHDSPPDSLLCELATALLDSLNLRTSNSDLIHQFVRLVKTRVGRPLPSPSSPSQSTLTSNIRLYFVDGDSSEGVPVRTKAFAFYDPCDKKSLASNFSRPSAARAKAYLDDGDLIITNVFPLHPSGQKGLDLICRRDFSALDKGLAPFLSNTTRDPNVPLTVAELDLLDLNTLGSEQRHEDKPAVVLCRLDTSEDPRYAALVAALAPHLSNSINCKNGWNRSADGQASGKAVGGGVTNAYETGRLPQFFRNFLAKVTPTERMKLRRGDDLFNDVLALLLRECLPGVWAELQVAADNEALMPRGMVGMAWMLGMMEDFDAVQHKENIKANSAERRYTTTFATGAGPQTPQPKKAAARRAWEEKLWEQEGTSWFAFGALDDGIGVAFESHGGVSFIFDAANYVHGTCFRLTNDRSRVGASRGGCVVKKTVGDQAAARRKAGFFEQRDDHPEENDVEREEDMEIEGEGRGFVIVPGGLAAQPIGYIPA